MTATARQRMLIADDHPLFREALRLVVERACPGAEVIEAGSYQELLELTREDERFDAIVVDLLMPGGNEFAELAALRRRVPSTPTLVVSSRDDRATIKRAMECGVAGYLSKSASMATMEGAVARVLAGELFVPEDDAARRPADSAALGGLTPRQLVVLEQLALGNSNRQIADVLCIEEITVKAHISAILRKMRVKNRLQAVVAFKSFV